ncbi:MULTISPECIES: LacI family DNA-binding transcriptional regulator [unclassified Spirosoma]|uniref:LacI family DNA-binding transcriptional regulator n=1 Tax=unclassified Spirosoma TaxID=2621999 RepID=UPI000963BF00|nr:MULTISPECIES: LacI family DNA-binding transcriptional regulator [unclassified Spirosoma]MBN8822042.1 LacI family DNA-binding transcriptional regulator [Spirosoma sp.]OJW80450.1 MAG: LacI family transcriptional regulator [Spirosoma sp. 48-14]
MHQTTIIDIARELGISKSTVSRALTGHPNVNAKTRQRVLDMAAQVDYQRNQLAISLLTNRTSTIGIIVPEFISFFFPKVIIGAQEELARSGYNVVICHSNESYETEVTNAKALLASRVDGLIVSHTKETRNFDHFRVFQRKGIPVVFFNRVCEDMDVSKVTVDDYNGAFQAVDHLIKTGRRRIAHLAGPDTLTNSRSRLNGYRDALTQHGIAIDPELIISYDLNLDKANIYVNHLLNLPNPPDALFTINDPTALEALNVAKRRGIRVPQDLAIVGFSDDPISALIEPGLTTIAQPVDELGKQAAQLLIKQLLADDERPASETIVLPTRLIVRGSTVN